MAPPKNPESSFVAMDPNDVVLVGQHCQYEPCNQLDFLPFHCQSCGGTFCLEHRTEWEHRCPREGAWGARRLLHETQKTSIGAGRRVVDRVAARECAVPACDAPMGTALAAGVHCDRCNRDYCIKHRLQEQHDCAKLRPVGARPSAHRPSPDKSLSVTDRLRMLRDALSKGGRGGAGKDDDNNKPDSNSNSNSSSSGGGVKSKKPVGSTAARLATLREMKTKAAGDDKIPPAKRVYLTVEAEAASTTSKVPRGVFFYSQEFSVGRLLDVAARDLQVENVNNRSGDEEARLRIFHVEGGRLLDFGEKVGDVLASGNTVVMLRGVGPPPELVGL